MVKLALKQCVLAMVTVAIIAGGSRWSLAAPTIAYEITGLPAAGNQAFGGEIGMDFAVNSPITLTSLGAFDSGQNGLSSTITVRLWQVTGPGTGVEIASQVFTPVSPGTLDGGYRFIDLASELVLAAGDYTISASGYGAELEGNENVGPIAARVLNDGGGLLTFGPSRFGGAAGAYPNSGVAPFGPGQFDEFVFLGPSFQFEEVAAVPEPASLVLWASIASLTFGIAWLRRRRRVDR